MGPFSDPPKRRPRDDRSGGPGSESRERHDPNPKVNDEENDGEHDTGPTTTTTPPTTLQGLVKKDARRQEIGSGSPKPTSGHQELPHERSSKDIAPADNTTIGTPRKRNPKRTSGHRDLVGDPRAPRDRNDRNSKTAFLNQPLDTARCSPTHYESLSNLQISSKSAHEQPVWYTDANDIIEIVMCSFTANI